MSRLIKKTAALLLCALLLVPAAGCRNDETPAPSATASAAPKNVVSRPIVVTFSRSVRRSTGIDPAATARKLGLETVTDNSDGSCTVLMTDEEQAAACAALRKSLDEQIAALPESGLWPFLDAVELNDACTDVTLHTSAARYSAERDRTIAQAIYIPTLLYTVFNGGDDVTFTLHFTVLDGKTELDTFDYPDTDTKESADASADSETSEDGASAPGDTVE